MDSSLGARESMQNPCRWLSHLSTGHVEDPQTPPIGASPWCFGLMHPCRSLGWTSGRGGLVGTQLSSKRGLVVRSLKQVDEFYDHFDIHQAVCEKNMEHGYDTSAGLQTRLLCS